MLRILFLLLIVMSSISFAQVQTNNQKEKKSYIFAELGKSNNTKVREQFLRFDNELNKQFDSQGFIINYGTDKEIARRERELRSLISFRKYDISRITFVRGGNTSKVKTVFWIVPTGAEPPKP